MTKTLCIDHKKGLKTSILLIFVLGHEDAII